MGFVELWRRWRLLHRERVVLARALIAVEAVLGSFEGAPGTRATLRAMERELGDVLWRVYRDVYPGHDPGELYSFFTALREGGIDLALYLRGFPMGPLHKYSYEVTTDGD